uniref:LYR motif-containing protein 5 n=1 Tax=Acartia pacifica TaxID=335913 RepID=A0A0U2IG45_ACAPC|nr:LYR motif-containing protein 5 [Acartia pacifica]
MSCQRHRVIQLYKNLLYLGREYPKGYDYFRSRCHKAFMKNKDLAPDQVEQWIGKGEYIIKELEALYMLKKYRTLKRRYYPDD